MLLFGNFREIYESALTYILVATSAENVILPWKSEPEVTIVLYFVSFAVLLTNRMDEEKAITDN